MLKIKIFIRNFLTGIGITSAFVTILWSLWSTALTTHVKGNELKYILAIIGVNLLISFYTIRKKKKLSVNLTTHVEANVFYGDLFQNNDIIVIPVNEYFDTVVDEKIISSNTLHGCFIKQFFDGNTKDLRQQI